MNLKRTFAIFLLAGMLVPMAILPSKASGSTNTIVSLEFDDGTTSQQTAVDILNKYNLKGTFYVNSERLGQSGFLGVASLMTFQNAGHEIGGHTTNHLDLDTLTHEQVVSEVAGDKKTLESKGFKISSLAYPFGSYNDDVQNVVAAAGYQTARTVGGIGYNNFRSAESIPPREQYATETLPSVKGYDTLTTLKNYVTTAENNGGGWLQVVMHKVNDSGETYSISPATLDAFSTWLASRATMGTKVKTVRDAVGGGNSVTPVPIPDPTPNPTPTPTPTPTPVPSPTDNLFKNPSLEIDTNSDNNPDLWSLIGWGTSIFKYSRVTDAHSGNFAERLDITSATGGDQKIVSTQTDLGGAPAASNKPYTVSAWYKSSVPVRLVMYYRTSTGNWNWLAESINLPAATTWTKAEWTSPSIPAGATNVSAGILIKSVGWLIADDFGLK